MINADGTVILATDRGRALLEMVGGVRDDVAPEVGCAVPARLGIVTAGPGLRQKVIADTAYGRHMLDVQILHGGRGEKRDTFAVQLRQQRAMSERVFRALARYNLSARQLEVARLLCENASNAEISETLGLSLNTVSSHLRALFSRLGIHERGEVLEIGRSSESSDEFRVHQTDADETERVHRTGSGVTSRPTADARQT